jgi:hypothetical protein
MRPWLTNLLVFVGAIASALAIGTVGWHGAMTYYDLQGKFAAVYLSAKASEQEIEISDLRRKFDDKKAEALVLSQRIHELESQSSDNSALTLEKEVRAAFSSSLQLTKKGRDFYTSKQATNCVQLLGEITSLGQKTGYAVSRLQGANLIQVEHVGESTYVIFPGFPDSVLNYTTGEFESRTVLEEGKKP